MGNIFVAEGAGDALPMNGIFFPELVGI